MKASTHFRFIALNSLDPTHKKQKGEQAIRTVAFWTMRGFQELRSNTFLTRLTAELEPQRLYGGGKAKCLTLSDFYKCFAVPEPEKGTMPMVWLPMPST